MEKMTTASLLLLSTFLIIIKAFFRYVFFFLKVLVLHTRHCPSGTSFHCLMFCATNSPKKSHTLTLIETSLSSTKQYIALEHPRAPASDIITHNILYIYRRPGLLHSHTTHTISLSSHGNISKKVVF